jgi:phenylalanine-4-hydroxylase
VIPKLASAAPGATRTSPSTRTGLLFAREHNRWDRLFKRSHAVLRHRACGEFLAMMEKLELSQSGIPDMKKLSSRLATLTGWRVVPVLELVPDAVFFDHLANRRFPAGAFIRSEDELD